MSPPIEELEQEIISLQQHVAYQEKTIEDLNQVIISQQRQLDILSQKVDQLIAIQKDHNETQN